jgi:mannose-6-phosphate isomerase-like protein (cupin superfamily)
MKSKYLDLQTGKALSAEQLLAFESGKDEIWKAADEMYSFLVDMAEDLELESQEQLLQASIIRGYLKKYDDALDMLDEGEGRHRVPESQRPESQNFAYIPPDGGKPFWFAGELYTAKAVGEDTSWSFTLLEALSPPGGGTLPHIHYREDETFYVLEGELEFMVEGSPIKVGAGSCLYVRRGTLHTYSNVGTQPARYLGVVTPAGIERFFEEVSVPALDRSSPPPLEQEDLDRILATAPKFGLDIRPPSEN